MSFRHQIYGSSAADPQILGLTAVALLAVALLASFLPGQQAGRVEPMSAIRDHQSGH